MKIRTIGNWLLILGCISLLWSADPWQLFAGQNRAPRAREFTHSSAAPAAPYAVDPAEEADIRQLINLVGTKSELTQVMKAREEDMRTELLHSFPPGPYRQRLVQLFMEKFYTKATPQSFINMSIPVYAQYFSDSEIKGLIRFYKTPLGQKWISGRGKVLTRVLILSNSWSRMVTRQILAEVFKEHPHLVQEFNAAYKAEHRR